jgi:hypothetical protein
VDIVYATATTMVGPYRVEFGSYWPADDPVVKAHPGLFSADPRKANLSSTVSVADDEGSPPVEMVTGAPGERRAQVRRG